MPDDLIRFAAEGGGGVGTYESPTGQVQDAIDALPDDIGQAAVGRVQVKGGDINELQTIVINHSFALEGIGPGLVGFRNQSKVFRAHSGPLIKFDPLFTDWMHTFSVTGLTLDGNKVAQPAVVDLVQCLRPGFNAIYDNVYFRNATGRGLHISQGADTLELHNTGFAGCNGGALHSESSGTSAFGVIPLALTGATQIDNCGPNPILLTMNGAVAGPFRSTIYLAELEFETSTIGDHTELVKLDVTGSDPAAMILIGHILVIDGSGGSGKKVLVESNTDQGLWVVAGGISANQSEFTHMFDGIRASWTEANMGPAIFGAFNTGGTTEPSEMIIDGLSIMADPAESGIPTISRPDGSYFMAGGGGGAGLIRKSGVWKTITTA